MTIGGIGPVEGFNRPNMTTKKPSGKDSASDAFSLAPVESKETQAKETQAKETQAKDTEAPVAAGAIMSTLISAPIQNVEPRQESQVAETKAAETKAGPGVVSENITAFFGSSKPAEPESALNVSIVAEKPKGSSQSPLDQVIQDLVTELGTVKSLEQDSRSTAMQTFLERMQSEFGVEPERIIKAFAQLTPEKLEASPEASMSDVLKSLGLKSEQMPKAERIYREMLNATGESALNEVLAGVGAGVTLKVLSEKEIAFDKLQKSITSLNDSFAIRPPAVASVSVPLETKEIEQTASLVETPSGEFPASEIKGSSERDIGAALKAALSPVSVEAGTTSELGVAQVAPTAKPVKLAEKKSSNLDSVLKEASVNVPQAFGSEQPATSVLAIPTAKASSSMLASAEGAAKENAQDVIRNAQLLLQKGGGEMKMQLKPEGVGEVHLKVQVRDGQVAVQMLTESDSAKKILESGLDDLKTSLAANKLHVDALKIEVGTEMAKQRFEQSQHDASREQARQMAQDFMGQFRQDREAFRQGFADGSGLRSYGGPRRPTPPEMEEVTTSNVNKKNSSSRRLDLVA